MAIYGDEKHNAGVEVSFDDIDGVPVPSDRVQFLSLGKVNIRLRVGVTAKGTKVGELVQGFEREEYEDAEQGLPIEAGQYNTALDALESLILAHACESIDVTSEAYQNGVLTALDALGNNL
jgi:hypothetical protein